MTLENLFSLVELMHGNKVSRRGVASKEASTQRRVVNRKLRVDNSKRKVVNRQLRVDKSKGQVVKLQKFLSTIRRMRQGFEKIGGQCTIFGTLE